MPEPTAWERIAPAAVVAAAAAMSTTVLAHFGRRLPHLARAVDEAMTAGRTHTPGRRLYRRSLQ
ncbi:hypothetical protein [Kitasatospora sp. LaBMicrA B282]|uniref:hypothetical protein n=1 Tax=Kitasatospora sp. LaBMicrA B282 TaxID=3420949 RepID=UPI003D141527